MKTITKPEAYDIIRTQKGNFFGVSFIKRTTGDIRVMQCQLKRNKLLKGGKPAYDHLSKALIPVVDTNLDAYRSIPLDSVFELRANGHTYFVE